MTESGIDSTSTRIASYRNAISWSVDKFMGSLFSTADLSHATIVYTSDHGQEFQPDSLTHCQVDTPDPRMGLIPLLVYTSDPTLRAQLQDGAMRLKNKTSQFQIAPTLLQLMGYRLEDIATVYDESLLTGSREWRPSPAAMCLVCFLRRSAQRQSTSLLTIWSLKQRKRTACREQSLISNFADSEHSLSGD